tara:strand:- start:116 stop:640 length:525 start_codon:yes stop_codon:yes gene_type:complete
MAGVEIVQGKILEAGDEGEGERKFVVILAENDNEYRIQSKFTNDAKTLRLLSDPTQIIGGIAKVRFTSKSRMSAEGEMKTYLNLQAVELVTPPEDAPERPIEGRLPASSLMMGGKDTLIVDQVLFKGAMDFMNKNPDTTPDDAAAVAIAIWEAVRERHSIVQATEEETEDESGS